MIMEKSVISLSPVGISLDELLSELHMDKEHALIEDIVAMLNAAVKIAKPAAVFAPLPVETSNGAIRLKGVQIDEPFVYEKLSECDTVIPFVSTCGIEIEAWSRSFDDSFEQFIADTIKQLCLKAIGVRLFSEVKENYFKDGEISTINPGSLADWPLTGQKLLFEILEGVTGDIGVELSESCLMIPTKSWSGVMFQTEKVFHNCQLCPKTDCPSRKAPFVRNQ